MKIAKSIIATRRAVKALRATGRPVVLIPTMGALHHGHLSLIRRARQLAGGDGVVVVSIFVNPTQFGPQEDFSQYPCPIQEDLAACRAEGVDLVFLPEAQAMYAEDASIQINETRLSRRLCGASRPGHFAGVCTVVTKLFAIIQPDGAIFGEKDWQQLAIIRRLVRDLNLTVRIVGQATAREADGLAASSRNLRLEPEERAVAPGIYAALRRAAERLDPRAIIRFGRKELEKIPGLRLDYLELVDAETLEPPTKSSRRLRLATAVFLGKTRLIDNIALKTKK